MVVLSNRRLGPASELVVSSRVVAEAFGAAAAIAASRADGRWECELAHWLATRAMTPEDVDVGDIAWTPEHFESQRRFLLAVLQAACEGGADRRTLERWAAMIEAHPRESVQVGRRWLSQPVV
jgi:hypothetical protein